MLSLLLCFCLGLLLFANRRHVTAVPPAADPEPPTAKSYSYCCPDRWESNLTVLHPAENIRVDRRCTNTILISRPGGVKSFDTQDGKVVTLVERLYVIKHSVAPANGQLQPTGRGYSALNGSQSLSQFIETINHEEHHSWNP